MDSKMSSKKNKIWFGKTLSCMLPYFGNFIREEFSHSDVRKPADMHALISSAIEKFGKVDTLLTSFF